MKQTIRHSLFETNSSSEHSLILTNSSEEFTEEEIRQSFWCYRATGEIIDGKYNIIFRPEDLTFERAPFEVLYTYCDKLRYYLASRAYIWTDEEYTEFTEELKRDLPWLNNIIFKSSHNYDDEYLHGYIDHQSSEMLAKNLNVPVKTFLKSKSQVIFIDGDEYTTTSDLINSHLITLQKAESEWGDEKLPEPLDLSNVTDYVDVKDLELELGLNILVTNDTSDYTEKESESLYIDEDGTLATNFYCDLAYSSEVKCIYTPREKWKLLATVHFNNPEKLKELENIAKRIFKGCTKVEYTLDLVTATDISNRDMMVLTTFIDKYMDSLEEFITSKNIIVLTNIRNIFARLNEAGLITPKFIQNVYSAYSLIEEEDLFND